MEFSIAPKKINLTPFFILVLLAISVALTQHALRHGQEAVDALRCIEKNGRYAAFVEPNGVIHNLCFEKIWYDIVTALDELNRHRLITAFIPKGGVLLLILEWLRRKNAKRKYVPNL